MYLGGLGQTRALYLRGLGQTGLEAAALLGRQGGEGVAARRPELGLVSGVTVRLVGQRDVTNKMTNLQMSPLFGPVIEIFAFYCLPRKHFLSRQSNANLSIRGPQSEGKKIY